MSKSLQVLPDKWSGLKDTDLRYRQRYVDLIMNTDVSNMFRKRALIVKEIKRVLEEDFGYLEVDTPILTTIAGGANARPFDTHHNTLDIDMKLRISNELYLKRLIVGGLDRVYEMGKMFRNEGMEDTYCKTLIVLSTTAEENLPMCRSRSHIESGRYKDNMRASVHHDSRDLRETKIIADDLKL